MKSGEYTQRRPAAATGDASPEEFRKLCMARIKTRLKRISAKKNAGLALFDFSDYLACLMVIESRD